MPTTTHAPRPALFLLAAVLTLGCAADSSPVGANPASPAAATAEDDLPLDRLELPDGFSVSVFSAEVPGARSMTLSPSGTLFVGTRDNPGRVYALVDADGDGRAERVHVVDERLDMPNGVAFRDGALYVAEVSRILRYDGIEERLADPPQPVVVTADYPSDRHHGWKFIAFGPDGWLYVPVGAPCNVCDEGGVYSSITRIRPDGGGREVYARGVRNTVGFDWRPSTGALWFSDNGRDWLGDDSPPDELNRAPEAGLHFGFPYCHGGDRADPDFGRGHPCADYTPPARQLGPHVAALGLRFYDGAMYPEEYRGQIFLAEHGSWNRASKIGYRVMLLRLEGDAVVSYEPFASGWLQGENAWGRPVDVEVAPDGALLVSDDRAGAVYRIAYTGG